MCIFLLFVWVAVVGPSPPPPTFLLVLFYMFIGGWSGFHKSLWHFFIVLCCYLIPHFGTSFVFSMSHISELWVTIFLSIGLMNLLQNVNLVSVLMYRFGRQVSLLLSWKSTALQQKELQVQMNQVWICQLALEQLQKQSLQWLKRLCY